MAQTRIQTPGPLLAPDGALSAVGWSPHPLLDCNLEQVRFYPLPLRPLQFLRVKRWDYYAVFTPRRFFSATIAHLGYAGNIFVYTLDWETGDLHEEGLVVPLGRGVQLPRNSTEGESRFEDGRVRLVFRAEPGFRHVQVDWPSFHNGRGIRADIRLDCPPDHESMTIVIPIGRRRFYYNRKINCMPASGMAAVRRCAGGTAPGGDAGLAGLGAGGLGVPEFLELGQCFRLPARRETGRSESGVWLRRPLRRYGELSGAGGTGAQTGRRPL